MATVFAWVFQIGNWVVPIERQEGVAGLMLAAQLTDPGEYAAPMDASTIGRDTLD